MRFSIVVPSYNEEEDIRETLDSLVALDYEDKEVIVVDDSTDSTPKIIRTYEPKGVRLIRPAIREGRCGARNIGIRASTGDVVVILNADVRLPRDFLNKILPFYEQGFDYVLVKAKVSNTEFLFARYVEAKNILDHYQDDSSWLEWTEGFSCRREVAIRAGLFPTGYPVLICAGEDGFFGEELRKMGAKKKRAFEIEIGHVAPSTFSNYWQIRKGRGKGSPLFRHFVEHWSLGKVTSWAILRIIKTSAYIVTVLPMAAVAWKSALCSKRGLKDLFPFIYAWLLEQIAFHVGEWESIMEIFHVRKSLDVNSR